MFSIKHMDKIVFIFFLCIFFYSSTSEGKPLGKRSVSEVQLMHNLGEHKYIQERQDWLQTKLKNIHTAALRNAEKGERVRARRLLPEDLPELVELTPNEIEYILNFLEKLPNSQQN